MTEERMTNLAIEVAYRGLEAIGVYHSPDNSVFEAMGMTIFKQRSVRAAYIMIENELNLCYTGQHFTVEELFEWCEEVAMEIITAYYGSPRSIKEPMIKAIYEVLRVGMRDYMVFE